MGLSPVWMPWDEALTRAGSFDALWPHLRAGSILARHNGQYSWPGGGAWRGPGDIKPGLWAEARVDLATERVIFTSILFFVIGSDSPPVTHEWFAIGIEVERARVEALWPAKPQSSENKRGAKPSAAWAKVQPQFDDLVDRDGPFPSLGSARESVKLLLKEKKLSRLNDRTIERWINKHRPQWVRKGA
jgi:hypothetical protein